MSTPLTAGPPRLLWEINARAVLEILDRSGPITRLEITRESGLSKTAVAQTLAELERRTIAVAVGLEKEGRGPAAIRYDLNRRFAHGVAIDLAHETVRASVIDIAGNVHAFVESPADHRSVAATAARVGEVFAECCARAGVDVSEVGHAFIGVAAAVTRGGELRLPSGLADEGRGLAEALRAVIPCELTIENDTNLTAVAEQHDGQARDIRDFALLSVAASVGAGIVVGGTLHRGLRGSAGEVAYLPGRDDTVDASLGEQSVREDSLLEGMPAGLSATRILDLAEAGDPAALRVQDRTAARVARAVAALALILDPELVILSGSIGGRPGLCERVVAHLTSVYPHVDVELVCADGSCEVIDGAAVLCAEVVREQAFTRAVTAELH